MRRRSESHGGGLTAAATRAGSWRIAFIDADPILVERTRASLEGGPFSFLALAGPPAPGGAELLLVDARLLGKGQAGREIPVIAYGPANLLRGALLAGCVDYLREPWTAEELSLRAHAALARVRARFCFPWGELALEGSELCLQGKCACGAGGGGPGGRVRLTPIEAHILRALLSRRGEAVPREALALRAGGRPARKGSRALDAHVSVIRRKIHVAFPEAGHRFIVAARGEGYLIP